VRDPSKEQQPKLGHAVQIKPSLQPLPPKNGNISKIRRRLSAISVLKRSNLEPGDRLPICKSLLLAGISGIAEGKISNGRTGWLGREDSNAEMVNWKLRVPGARFDVSPLSETIRENARNRAK
jgi:hypothetical protein